MPITDIERHLPRSRVHAGLARARAAGVKLGRPRISTKLENRIKRHLAAGPGILKTARLVGVGSGTVQRILCVRDPSSACRRTISSPEPSAVRVRTPTDTRDAVAAGIRRYCADRRARIPAFVDRHFSLRGTLELHRAALGWDVVRAPINLAMAAPALALHLAAAGLHRIGARRCADALGRRRLLLHTSVAQRVEWLVCHELLELPTYSDATRDVLAETIISEILREQPTAVGRNEERLLQRTVTEYAGTRGAAAEIATGLLSLGTGALTFGKLTPGVATFAPMLASMLAQQAAIASFPLGAGLGALWYGLFPANPSVPLLLGLSGGLTVASAMLAAFAGIVSDPVQRRFGLHQRRLNRMIDSIERQLLDPAAPGFAARDRYVARLLDAFDLTTAAYRLAR